MSYEFVSFYAYHALRTSTATYRYFEPTSFYLQLIHNANVPVTSLHFFIAVEFSNNILYFIRKPMIIQVCLLVGSSCFTVFSMSHVYNLFVLFFLLLCIMFSATLFVGCGTMKQAIKCICLVSRHFD